MRNSCPTNEGKWAISCIVLIRCQARRLQQLVLQYYWNPDETTTKFSTLKKTQLLRSQNVFKLHYIARKLARIYWTSNFQMTQKKTQQQQHHITYILGSVLIIVSRMPASAEVRNSTILRGERGQKKKKTTTTSDLRKEKREEKKKKKKKLWKFSSSAGEYDRLDAVAAAAALEPWPRTAATAQQILQLHATTASSFRLQFDIM